MPSTHPYERVDVAFRNCTTAKSLEELRPVQMGRRADGVSSTANNLCPNSCNLSLKMHTAEDGGPLEGNRPVPQLLHHSMKMHTTKDGWKI